MAFSPDGRLLASGSDDRTVLLWDVDPESWVERACRLADRSLTAKEWARYLPGKPYRAMCP